MSLALLRAQAARGNVAKAERDLASAKEGLRLALNTWANEVSPYKAGDVVIRKTKHLRRRGDTVERVERWKVESVLGSFRWRDSPEPSVELNVVWIKQDGTLGERRMTLPADEVEPDGGQP